MNDHKEEFSGNIYIFLPGYFKLTSAIAAMVEQAEKKSDSFGDELISELTTRFNTEISSQVHTSLKRYYLGTYSLACYDDLECTAEESFYEDACMFVSVDNHTQLCVVTLMLHEKVLPVSQLLDRLSQDKLILKQENQKVISLKKLLEQDFGLITMSAAKTCLSTRESISDDILPYYFANETFESSNMAAKITSAEFQLQMRTNIAQYDSSDLYVGRQSVLRVDKRVSTSNYPALSSDSVFLFIMEALLFKEASVLRTNENVVKSISNSELLELETMDQLTSEFATTMPFWDIKIFKYLTAQQLANKLDTSFGINQRFEQYENNQQFLQHKINIRQGMVQSRENKVLYLIAIILFVFEIGPYLYEMFKRLLAGDWYSELELCSILGTSISTGLLVFLIVIWIKRRSNKRHVS